MSIKEQWIHFRTNSKQFWGKQPKSRKIIVGVIAGLIVMSAIIFAVILNNQEEYTVLYSGLGDTEYQEIVTELERMDVDVQITSGNTIAVLESVENQVRMDLAMLGYPKSPITNTIWSESIDMFTTDSQLREIERMQTQDRLQSIIGTLEGIEAAVVNLDIPESSNNVLTTNKSVPTASVVVYLKEGVVLTNDQIIGINHIVSSSIVDLTEENVSIMDGAGNPLNIFTAEELAEMESAGDQDKLLAYKKDFEGIIKDEIMNLLINSYGEDGVNVAVNATLDFDKSVSENTEYTPSVDDSGMVEYEEDYQASGEGVTPGGDTVGVEPNADGTFPTGTTGDTTTNWSEQSSSTSYLVNTLKTQTEKAGYNVERVSVSVVVYTDILTEAERVTIQGLAANAAGTAVEFVSVGSLPKFEDRLEPVDPDDPTEPGDQTGEDDEEVPVLLGLSLMQILVIGGIIILIIIIIIIILLIRKRKKKKEREKQLRLEQEEAERLMLEEQARQEAERIALEAEVHKLGEEETETKEAMIRREIEEFITGSPEIAATLLKNWIREDD